MQTPMAALLCEALEYARAYNPELTDSKIARDAGITHPTLSRAKHSCAPATLLAVLNGIRKSTRGRVKLRLILEQS